MKKRLLSVLLAAVLLLGLLVIPGTAAEAGAAMAAAGWYETICAELTGVTKAQITKVAWQDQEHEANKGEMSPELDKVGETAEHGAFSFKYLVREVDGKVRIDIPGVKVGSYDLTVTVGEKDYVAQGIEVKAYDRSGFAHKVHTVDEEGNITGIADYTEGVGAYNDDGTLKENVTVLYVTEQNKNDVSLTVMKDGQEVTVTGIGNILNCKGYDVNNGKPKILLRMTQAKRPLVVRIIGEVTKPEGVTAFIMWNRAENTLPGDNGGGKGDNGGMCIMQYPTNITIEGIGSDALVNGWGFCFDTDSTGMGANKLGGNKGNNCEVRNLTFRNVPEDCVGIQGGLKNSKFDSPAEHIWVHNNSFYGPKDLPDASKDRDKSEGDGAVDFNNGQYMTMSYNYFEGYHKTSLVGGDDSLSKSLQYHVTWHHNWWKNVQSRSPLCRRANVHIYNNLYDGQTSYCMSLRVNCFIFSEYNTFSNCRDPFRNEGSGGVAKSYGDVFTRSSGFNETDRREATFVDDRSETVTSNCDFANFDLDPDLSYIPGGNYSLETDTEKAVADIRANAGAMKQELDVPGYPSVEYGAMTGDGGTLYWAYTPDGDVMVDGAVGDGQALYVAAYENGKCVAVRAVTNGSARLGKDVDTAKLFWLGTGEKPVCQAGGWGWGSVE